MKSERTSLSSMKSTSCAGVAILCMLRAKGIISTSNARGTVTMAEKRGLVNMGARGFFNVLFKLSCFLDLIKPS